MNIFSSTCYKQVMRQLVEERKAIDPTVSFKSLAESSRIAKSYLSKALAGKAMLSSDQLELACEFLQLTDVETDYMQLLLLRERTSLARKKRKLDEQIRKVQKKYLNTEKVLESALSDSRKAEFMEQYYLDPYHQIIHISLDIPRFKRNPKLLAEKLGLSSNRMQTILNNLERMGIIEINSSEISLALEQKHLEKSSRFFGPWINQLRAAGVQRMNRLEHDQFFSFAAVFTTDAEGRQEIEFEFLEFLKKAEKIAKKSPSSSTYQLSFELFPWA